MSIGARLRLAFLLAPGLAAMAGGTALADGPSPVPMALSGPATQQQVVAAAQRSAVMMHNPCPLADFAIGSRIVTYRQASVDGSGNLVGGAWKETVRQRGCGVERVLNVLLLVQGPGTVATIPLAPGTTRADPVLQRDAIRYAEIASGVPEKNCGTGYLADTAFIAVDAQPVRGGKDPPWRETWTLVGCTRKVVVPMTFIPDSTGTTIAADAKGTRTLPLDPAR